MACRGGVVAHVVCVLLLSAGPASGAERFRTPAEIEARRAQVAARLSGLAVEAAAIEARLTTLGHGRAEAPDLAGAEALERERQLAMARLDAIAAERRPLAEEAAKLAAIRTRGPTGPLGPADPVGLVPGQAGGQPAGSTQQASAGNAFNPSITVIPDGLYYTDNRHGRAPSVLAGADGFVTTGSDEAEALTRGFQLREAEVTFTGAVDPYFDFFGTFAVADDTVEAEEVYVQTRRLLPGVQVRFGHFLSGIGHINRQHPHQWDFVDQALPYTALFGDRLAETGVQVTWLPALSVYTQLGFEALQGENPLIARRLVDDAPEILRDVPGPRLFTGFLKVSPELGFAHTLQAGVSFGRSRSHQEPAGDATDAVRDGATWFVATDWIWRFDSSRPFGQGDLTVQGEYLYRVKTFDPTPLLLDAQAARQDGAYAQAVYGIGPRWTVAGRLDAIGMRNQIETGTLVSALLASHRYSGNLTFNPTEFSRLRVQYNHARVSQGRPVNLDQVFVQLQVSLGVHGAHRF
jgi:hypothetical protein